MVQDGIRREASATVRPITLMHVTTVPQTLAFLRGQAAYLKALGFAVYAVSSPGAELGRFSRSEGVSVAAVNMQRRITPLSDLRACLGLFRAIRAVRPEIVHAHTPKGGLLGMIASAAAGVPVRIYHVHGLPALTAFGTRRLILTLTEAVSCRLATRVLSVSEGVAEQLSRSRLCRRSKLRVPLKGSISGVDAEGRFNPELKSRAGAAIRRQYGIPQRAFLIGFVGRIVRDKGISELVTAWQLLRDHAPDLHMMLVGSAEAHDPVSADTDRALRTDPRVHLVGNVADPSSFYAAMNVVVLPTYREGFPVVPLEAAAMQLPVVATTVPGCKEAVRDRETGLLVPARDPIALAEAIRSYIDKPELGRVHGVAGRERVLREFRPDDHWRALHDEYLALLNAARGRLPLRFRSQSGLSTRGLQVLKRWLDIVGALVGVVLLLPILGALVLAIWTAMGSPIMFRQQRPGLLGRPFTLLKFRTMTAARDIRGRLLPDAARLTRLGLLLRTTSLDELPELFNVLRGDMSLVGPRPLLIEYLDRYTPEQRRRHEVKPGVTGWAQVNGRNALSWEEKFKFDVWYVDNRSLGLDLRILAITFWKVLKREGITQSGQATMEEFLGARCDAHEGSVRTPSTTVRQSSTKHRERQT